MSRSRPPFSPEVSALLDRERDIPPAPAPLRARALARARAAVVAGRVTTPSGFPAAPRPRWGVLTAACVATAAVAATAYEIGAHRRSPAGDRPSALVVPVAAPSSASSPEAVVTPPASAPHEGVAPPAASASSIESAPSSRAPSASLADPGPDELRLLRQARAAVSRQDFAAALVPIAEHARRFKNGRLAEEREALRVRALSGLGRTDEAQRASDAFEARFPRSVLLPAVRRMPASEQ